jgi:hypothetical protein
VEAAQRGQAETICTLLDGRFGRESEVYIFTHTCVKKRTTGWMTASRKSAVLRSNIQFGPNSPKGCKPSLLRGDVLYTLSGMILRQKTAADKGKGTVRNSPVVAVFGDLVKEAAQLGFAHLPTVSIARQRGDVHAGLDQFVHRNVG